MVCSELRRDDPSAVESAGPVSPSRLGQVLGTRRRQGRARSAGGTDGRRSVGEVPIGAWWLSTVETGNAEVGLAQQARCPLAVIPDQAGVPWDECVVGGSGSAVVVDDGSRKPFL